MNTTFNATPSGIFNLIVKPTSRMKKKAQIIIYTRDPVNANALIKSGLAPKYFQV